MGQFSNPVATHPRTNEVEVPPPPGRRILVDVNRKVSRRRCSCTFKVFVIRNSNFVKNRKDGDMSLLTFIKLKCELTKALKSRLVNC